VRKEEERRKEKAKLQQIEPDTKAAFQTNSPIFIPFFLIVFLQTKKISGSLIRKE